MSIHRYKNVEIVNTVSEPFSVLLSWINGLRSTGYVSDLISELHGITNKEENKESSKLISTLADNAVELMGQAISGSPEVSFLPIYYSLQNLAKIYIILAGQRAKLFQKNNRYHGATRVDRNSRKLLSEELSLKSNGTIPLFYEVLTGEAISSEVVLKLSSIYPYVNGITFEFQKLFRKPAAFQNIQIEFEGDSAIGHVLTATIQDSSNANANNLTHLKVLKGFKKDPTRENTFIAKKRVSDPAKAKTVLLAEVRRFLLLSDQGSTFMGPTLSMPRTPISNSDVLLPQEFPILLVCFHLSILVRYFPDLLSKFRDSPAWGMLLNLRRDSVYDFLLAFWSFLHKTNYLITAS